MIFLYLSLACTDGTNEGTIIGNPGDGKGKLAESENVEIFEAEAVDPQIILYSGDDFHEIDLDLEEGFFVDLMDPDQGFEIPAGIWTSMRIKAEFLYVFGEIDIGEDWIEFDFELENIDISLNGQKDFTIDSQEFILEIGTPNWLNEETLSPFIDEDEMEIENFEEELLEVTEERSGFYTDSDGDGEVDEEEREHPVAYTEEMADEVEEEEEEEVETETETDSDETEHSDDSGEKKRFSAGCSDNSVQLALVPLLALLGLRRRREE